MGAGDINTRISTNDRSEARASSGVSGMNGDNSVWGLRSGDWVVNVPNSAGAGLTVQGGAGAGSSWLLMAGAGLVLFWLLRKRGR